MQCSGLYGIPDMQQDLMFAAAAGHQMFPEGVVHEAHVDAGADTGARHNHDQVQQFHLQQQQAEILQKLYQRQVQAGGLLQEHQGSLHASQSEVHSSSVHFSGLHRQLPNLSNQLCIFSKSNSDTTLASKPTSAYLHHDPVQYVTPLNGAGSASTELTGSPMERAQAGEMTDMGAEELDKVGTLGGSRWPRHETLTLLRIRSEMDSLFRDSGAKGPLWEEVSRKLFNAGYPRSAKKCKEKFENVHKYYKKTKVGKTDRQDGRTYRFRTELEAIYAANQDLDMQEVSEGGAIAMTADQQECGTAFFAATAASTGNSSLQQLEGVLPLHLQSGPEASSDPHSSSSASYGDEYEELVNVPRASRTDPSEPQWMRRCKRKRCSWLSFFEDLAKQLMERQDGLHKKFLEAVEKREEEKARREESYKRQEMARLKREQELRAQEQALAATRDAALVAFLQKVTGERLQLPEMQAAAAGDDVLGAGHGMLNILVEDAVTPASATMCTDQMMIKEGGFFDAANSTSCRWPKVEVLSLIRVRTSLEPRFQEAGPKAQLWEAVSSSMACLGFSRSAKRCKEKWENINKYYRKTKDNTARKLRRLDYHSSTSKTCPYFHQLEVLYERGILASPNSSSGMNKTSSCMLDGSQDSEEVLESTTSKDDSQHTLEGNQYAGPAEMQAATDGGAASTMACSAPRAEISRPKPILCDLEKERPSLSGLGLINHSPHFNHFIQKQQQQLAHRDNKHTPGKGNATMAVAHVDGVQFVMDLHQSKLSADDQLYETHQQQLVYHHHAEHGEMQRSADHDADLAELRTQHQEISRLDPELRPAHSDNATLMALVRKLATADGGQSSEFDLSSPASPE